MAIQTKVLPEFRMEHISGVFGLSDNSIYRLRGYCFWGNSGFVPAGVAAGKMTHNAMITSTLLEKTAEG